MKTTRIRLAALLLAAVTLLSLLSGCDLFQKKSDEELIRDRINTFVEDYNNGDWDGVLDSMTASKRNTLKAMFNVVMRFMPDYLPSMDELFSLSIAGMSSNIRAEIQELRKVSDTAAEVDVIFTYSDTRTSKTSPVRFYLKKEKRNWFIDDLKDR